MIEHTLSCPKGDLVLARHGDAAKEWGTRESQYLTPSTISYRPQINSRTVQKERNGVGARQEGETSKGKSDIAEEAQGGGGNERARNKAADLERRPGQVAVPAESRADVSVQGFWKQGTHVMFEKRIVSLDAGSYLRITPEKSLAKAEKDRKDLYIQDFLEIRRFLTPMVNYANRIPGTEALAAQNILATLISFKLKREYSELCGLVRARMSLEIVRSNILLLHGPWDKEACIQQWHELLDVAVMSLLESWRG